MIELVPGSVLMDCEMQLMLNIRPAEEIDLRDWAIVIVKDLNLVAKFILNCFDPMGMNHSWGNGGIVVATWDETKLNRFLIAFSFLNSI